MYSILIDITKCTGCEKCVGACIEANNLNPYKADVDRATTKDGLSDNRLLSIIKLDKDHFARKSCMHCEEPSCVSACLVGGITKSKEGPVIYDPDKCIGCRYCMLACPFHIPRYEWDETKPFMKKCMMCYDKLKEGKQPACVEACPNKAMAFGNREDMLKLARQKINADPGTYINHIWGEKEFGGTSVLYISDVDLKQLGFPESARPIPALTEPLIEKTPVIGGSVAVGLIGLNWIIGRRNKLAKENAKNYSEKNEDDKNE